MNLEELKKVVEKTTPGPWACNKVIKGWMGETGIIDGAEVRDGNQKLILYSSAPYVNFGNLEYIATFNPSLVSKLLRVVEAAKEFEVHRPYVIEDSDLLTGLELAIRDLEQS